MTSQDLKEKLFELVEGLDQQVESAADLNAEGFNAFLDQFPSMSAGEKEENAREMVFALARGLKYGTVEIFDVM